MPAVNFLGVQRSSEDRDGTRLEPLTAAARPPGTIPASTAPPDEGEQCHSNVICFA